MAGPRDALYAAISILVASPFVRVYLARHLTNPDEIRSIGVYTQGLNGPAETIFSANVASNASGWYYPRKAVHTSAGVVMSYGATFSAFDKFALFDNLVFSVGGSDTGLAGSPYKLTAYWRK